MDIDKQAEGYLALAMIDAWAKVNPDRAIPDHVREAMQEVAQERAAGFALIHPDILTKLTKADIDRIDNALEYHFNMTERTEEDDANQDLCNKIARLVEEAPTPRRRRPRR